MQTKNAIGNLKNRYLAVRKKCHLLNTFGTLALSLSLLASPVATLSAQASYNATPTLGSTAAYTITELATGAVTANGTVTLDGVTLADYYSLSNVSNNAGLQSVIMAGTLSDEKTVSAYGIVKNDAGDYELDPLTSSTIEGGSKLTLTGANETALLDEGSLTNSGELILGSTDVETASFNGELQNKGTTTVLSNVTFNGNEVVNNGTISFATDVTFNAGFANTSGTATFTGDNTTINASSAQIINASIMTFEGENTTIDGYLLNEGDLTFEGSANLKGDFVNNEGTTTFKDAVTFAEDAKIMTGTVDFNADATFTNGLDISNSGTVNFTGDTTISGAVASSGTLNFDETATLDGNLQVNDGTTTFNGLSEVQNISTLNNAEIIINTGSNLTVANLNLNDGDNGEVTVNGTLTMNGTITWDSGNDDDDNQILVNNGGNFITGTSNIYTYTSGDTVTFADNLSSDDLAFVDVSTLSFSGVTEISKSEYDAVKASLYDTSTGLGYEENTSFLFNFGDAVITGVDSTEIAGTDGNNVNIEYNVPSTVATPDGSGLSLDDATSTNITASAVNSGSLGGLIFENVDNSATSLLYNVGSQNITLAGVSSDSDNTTLVGASTASGSQILADVLVGDDTTGSGTLTLGTANTSENKTGTLGSVTLTSGSTMNVTGASTDSGEAITSSFTVENATILTENTSINVDNNAILNLSGTTTLAEGSFISVTGNSTTTIDSIAVNNTGSDTPYLFVDPSYVGIKDISGDTLDFHIYVSEGSVVNIGDGESIVEGTENATELQALFKKMDYLTTSDLATGGFIPTDTTQTMLYLGLGKTLTLGAGNIIIDDQVTDGDNHGTITFDDGSSISPSGVYFGADSFFVADLTGFSENMAVIDGSSKDLYVDSTSTLGIVGATAGTYTILTDFVESANSDIWDYDVANNDIDVYVGNTLQEISSVSGDGTSANPYQVTISIVEDSILYNGSVGEIVENAANYQGEGGFSSTSDNAGVRFIYNATSSTDQSKQEQIIEGAAQLSAIAGTNANTYYANRAAVNTQQGRYHLYDVTALGNQNKGASDLNVVTYNVDGSTNVEFSGVIQVASNGSLNNLLSADNLQNSNNSLALWLMPFYSHESINGMAAGSYSSDYKTDMYGVAAGIDKTFTQIDYADALRLGLSFNTGRGETNTNGDFDYLENDFDFLGLSAYTAAQFGKFTLSADLSYLSSSSEIYQDLSSYSVENLKSNVNSDLWSFGLRAEYTHLLENNVKIIPYLGLELFTIKTGSYSVNANTALGGTIFTVESERQNVLSVPLGLTVNKNFAWENGWNVTPEARIGGIFATGDLSEKSITRMPGVDGIANMSMEVLDPATLNIGLGLDASHNNLRFSLDYNLQVSKNLTSHDIMGVVEWKF